MKPSILTPVTLWENFNSLLPLQISTIKSYSLNKAVISHVYFSGRNVGGERVRIFGVYARQPNKKANTIILLPDVRSGVSEDLVIHFSSLGYNVLSVDLGGSADFKENYTRYPEKISYANYLTAGETFYSAKNGAEKTCWYEWCAVAKYAVSFVKELTPNAKIGVLGVKYGADVAWMLTGSDDRVTASTFAFGAGWHAYKGLYKYADSDLELNDERYRFISGVDSQSYAQNVKVPVMFMSTTNNEEFDAERSLDTLQRVSNEDRCWFAFITNAKDVLDAKCLQNVELFFEKFISGRTVKFYQQPKLESEIIDEEVVYKAEVSKLSDVDRVYLFSSFNDITPINRVWVVLYPHEITKNQVFFKRKIFGKVTFETSFVTVVYKNGLTLTSRFNAKKINVLSGTKLPNVVYSTYNIHSCFIVKDGDLKLLGEVFPKDKLVDFISGPHDILGLSTKYDVYTYSVKNYADKISDKSFIQFDAYTPVPDALTLTFTLTSGQEFSSTVNLDGKGEWQRVTAYISEFKNEIGMPFKKHEELLSLKLSSLGATAINNILIL
ncbi:MAG: hypothetical protein IKL82_04105 [Clostridia bacterium]|nr:hypothetical protein [Clostridia bacterium]